MQGSYHPKNQDSYWAGEVPGGWVVVLSDGIGSCEYSEVGSSVLCDAVRDLAGTAGCLIDNPQDFAKKVEECWLANVSGQSYEWKDCHATALFAVLGEERTYLFRLGDGVLGAVIGSEPVVMFDAKEDSYSNITDCIGIGAVSWEIREAATKEVECIFICSDGVSDDTDESNLAELVMGFCDEYRGMIKDEIEADLSSWIPALKSKDDKTVVFLFA